MKNLLPPPWIKFPHIDPFSIGWRMGAGEDYKFKFNDWLKHSAKMIVASTSDFL